MATTTRYLPDNYQINPTPAVHDDTMFSCDFYQKEVYETARLLADPDMHIVDIGCGSGFKLLKNFHNCNTTGMELPATVSWLRCSYPDRKWITNDQPIPRRAFIICSDVIEHLTEPEKLMDAIAESNPVRIVLSTPSRDLLWKLQPSFKYEGPPVNPCHVMEWGFQEFEMFVSQWFRVDQHFISNESQGTQCLVCCLP